MAPLTDDELAKAWREAKAERDAAIEAAYQIPEPDDRAAAIEAARAAWQARKTELLEG